MARTEKYMVDHDWRTWWNSSPYSSLSSLLALVQDWVTLLMALVAIAVRWKDGLTTGT